MKLRFWHFILAGAFLLTFVSWLPAEEPQSEIKPQGSATELAQKSLPFTISIATTHITKPLKPDGTVDYVAAINSRMSEGVTPENNAAVLLMRAIGVEVVPEAHRETFFKALGVPVPNGGQRLLQDYGELMEERLKGKESESEVSIDRTRYGYQQTQSMERPWSRKEFPLVADWLDSNAKTLKITLDASQRSRLCFPIVVPEGKSLITQGYSFFVSDFRELARLLTSRAMLALTDDDIDAAIGYQLACHRLAALLGQQPTTLETLVSYSISAIACHADISLVASRKLNGQQAAQYRQQIESLPPLPMMSEKYNFGERLIALDSICNVANKKLDPELFDIANQNLLDRLFWKAVEWDAVLKRFNDEYDDLAATFNQKHHVSRRAAFRHKAGELKNAISSNSSKAKQKAIGTLILLGIAPPHEVVNRRVGDLMLAAMTQADEIMSTSETRVRVRRDLLITALALSEFEREHGGYPERLRDLRPRYLKTLPPDRFTEQPLQYQRQHAGFLLYSIGDNEIDDKGMLGLDADDIAIRVPKLPEP